MIPITENSIKAVAALIYNEAYDQDPGYGWIAGDAQNAPGYEPAFLAWSEQLLKAIQELPEATDEEIIETAKKRVDAQMVGFWNSIHMNQTEDGDEYSTITDETRTYMNDVRDFLEEPVKYTEIHFIENDPAFLEWWNREL